MSHIKGKRITKSDEPTEESIAFAEYCRGLFEYKEGQLIRKVNKGPARVGDIAGTLNNRGYFAIIIDSVSYQLHQIVFLLHYNYIPKVIDHIDRNKTNNTVENLRSVTSRENSLNTLRTSEMHNIYYRNDTSYIVRFQFEGNTETFGTYKTIEEAIEVRNKISNDGGLIELKIEIKICAI